MKRLRTWCRIAALTGSCVLAGSASGDDVSFATVRASDDVINLRTGDVFMGNLADSLGGDQFGYRWALLRLDSAMTRTRAAALSAAGARVTGYYPTLCFLADVSGTTPARLRALGFVTAVYQYQTEWKVDPAIRAVPGRAHVNAWLFGGMAPGELQAAAGRVATLTIEEVEPVGDGWRVSVSGPATDIALLAERDDIQYLEPIAQYSLRSNAMTRWTVQSGIPNVTPLYDHNITGVGSIIGIIDGGLAVAHCSFIDTAHPIGPLHRKVVAYNAAVGYNLHGTHVSGTAAGDAGNSSDTRGVAYGARIAFNTYPSASETSVFSKHYTHYTQGAYIGTNSWGTDSTRAYDGGSRAIDTFLHDNDDALVTHAASNSSIVTNPENAKNSLCVFATLNGTNSDTWCGGGSGPTLDGRRKPEVGAPGCDINSAGSVNGCDLTLLSGTSMATPAVGGLAVLVREYYVSGYYPSGAAIVQNSVSPSGALVKATIVNGAQDLTSVQGYPSNREGWGRVLGDASLYFAGDQRKMVVRDIRNVSLSALDTNEFYQFSVQVEPSSEPLRVTMSYHDVAAQVNASLTPVNNLDLIVTSPDGVVYRGNVFVNGYSATGGAGDPLNNTEQVHIAQPTPGVWHVLISATAVNASAQGFAVVATGAVSEPPPCPADINQDGGVDGLDIESFFAFWANGEPAADFNQDGGVDGGDIEAFFEAWSIGC
jgi:hypothetical protein